MNCTHPVLYDREDGLYCHICGALIAPKDAGDKPQANEEKAVKTQKKPVKRKTAKADN
jgi:hypothetical protein